MSGEEIRELTGKSVLVRMMNENKIAGELKSFSEDLSLTLTENGGPEPNDNDFVMGDTNYENVNNDRIINWDNVESVELLEDYRDSF